MRKTIDYERGGHESKFWKFWMHLLSKRHSQLTWDFNELEIVIEGIYGQNLSEFCQPGQKLRTDQFYYSHWSKIDSCRPTFVHPFFGVSKIHEKVILQKLLLIKSYSSSHYLAKYKQIVDF